MSQFEEIVEEVLCEKRKMGFRARTIRTQENLTAIQIEEQMHGVQKVIVAQEMFEIYKLKKREKMKERVQKIVDEMMDALLGEQEQ